MPTRERRCSDLAGVLAAARAMLWVLVCAGLFAGTASVARAATARRVSLNFTRGDGASSCIDPVTLAHRVEAYTGPVLVALGSAETAVEAHVEGNGKNGFRARIQITAAGQTPHGERLLELETGDCRRFDDALAFVIATTIDPDLVLEHVAELFDSRATPPKQALLEGLGQNQKSADNRVMANAVPTPAQQAARRQDAASASLAPARRELPDEEPDEVSPPWSVGVGMAVSSELRRVALGPTAQLRLRVVPWLELDVGLRLVFAQPIRREHGTVTPQQAAGAVSLCLRLPARARLSLATCAGPELAVLRGIGRGFTVPYDGYLSLPGGLLRAEAMLRVWRSYSLALSGLMRIAQRGRLTYELGATSQEALETPRTAFAGELRVVHAF